ncbi:kappa-type opioid receptor-like isoform X2 [Convolutriloba macropyga]|uniref:kappa-type opioid receptor-like isoform X2 n=1 Tax=Convolutriloba macropyga TaxID=536237 RepID=UPI003F520B19
MMFNVSTEKTEDIEITSPEVNESGDPITLDWIRRYFGLIGVFGIIFNMFTISIVARLGGSKSASGLSVQLLAFWNSLALVVDALFEMVFKTLLDFNIYVAGPWPELACKTVGCFDWLVNHSANWHVVLICLNRYISVGHPIFYHKTWTRKHVWMCSWSIILFTWISQLPFAFFYRAVDGECVLEFGNVVPEMLLFVYLNVQIYILYFIVPGFFILTFSILFMIHLNTARSKFERNKRHSAERLRVEAGFRRMIMALVASYIILGSTNVVGSALYTAGGHEWAYNLGDGALVLQNSLNLFFYILSGPVFREALYAVSTCKEVVKSKVSRQISRSQHDEEEAKASRGVSVSRDQRTPSNKVVNQSQGEQGRGQDTSPNPGQSQPEVN